MDKKITAIIIGLSLLIAGVSSAALYDVYGKVTRTLQFVAPDFYVDSGDKLLIDEMPSESKELGIDNTHRTFKSEEIGKVDFNYKPDVLLNVRTKVATSAGTATNTTPELRVAFGYYKDEGADPDIIYEETIEPQKNFNNWSFSKSNSEEPKNVHRFYYEFEATECTSTCDYYIESRDTSVELSD